jgi:predicted TIM-barrel fold metal-dependent hydrolase
MPCSGSTACRSTSTASPQLAGLAEVAAAHPEVPLVIDHLGLPIREDGLSDWRAGMTALARLGHVSVKLSGAGFIDAPFDGTSFADVLDEVLDLFGPARILAASNFPTDRLFARLDATWSAYAAWAARLSMEQQRALWGGNADRVYRIGSIHEPYRHPGLAANPTYRCHRNHRQRAGFRRSDPGQPLPAGA